MEFKLDEHCNVLLPKVTSSGLTGKEWIAFSEKRKINFGGIGWSGVQGISKIFFEDKNFISTKNITYQPVAILGEKYLDGYRNLPFIVNEAGATFNYNYAPTEVLMLLLQMPNFENYLQSFNCRCIVCVHGNSVFTFGDNHILELEYYPPNKTKTLRGILNRVNLCMYSDCVFIFTKDIKV